MTREVAARVAGEMARDSLIAPEASVLALVSGGADSMCLLDILHRLHPGRLGVLTFDHGLRSAAQAECALVAREAGVRGCEVWTEQLDVTDGPNLQSRARDARRSAARELADREGFTLIATGHTATDQAETILFRLARGTGRSGAIGIRARSGRHVRPLRSITREATRAWCDEHGIPYVDDPSNGDRRFARTRVRADLVPALGAVHPGAVGAIVRFADQLADEQELLAPLVDDAWARCAHEHGLRAPQLGAEPAALGRLVARRFLRDRGIAADERWVGELIDMARGGARAIDMPGGRVERERGVISHVPGEAAPPAAVDLPVPGRVSFGGRIISAHPAPALANDATAISIRTASDLQVRSLQPGDRIPLCGGGHARVGRLLADCGVARHLRSQVPVVVDGGRIIWVAGYRADPHVLAAAGDNAIRLEMV